MAKNGDEIHQRQRAEREAVDHAAEREGADHAGRPAASIRSPPAVDTEAPRSLSTVGSQFCQEIEVEQAHEEHHHPQQHRDQGFVHP